MSKLAADHRRGVQHRLRFGGQPIDSGRKYRLHRCGDSDFVDVAHQAIPTTAARQHSAAGQVTDDLFDEERVADRRNCDPLGQARQRRIIPEKLPNLAHCRGISEWVQRDRLVGIVVQRTVKLWPIGRDEH